MLEKIKPIMPEAMCAYMGDAVNERESIFQVQLGVLELFFLSTNIQKFLFVHGMTNQLTCIFPLMRK